VRHLHSQETSRRDGPGGLVDGNIVTFRNGSAAASAVDTLPSSGTSDRGHPVVRQTL